MLTVNCLNIVRTMKMNVMTGLALNLQRLKT
jgi:hypothetical protein